MYGLDSTTGRRRFIQGAGVAVVGASVVGTDISTGGSFGAKDRDLTSDPTAAQKWGREAGDWIPSCCNMCGGQCGILVHVANGVVDKIEPNPWNPNNYANVSTDFFDGYTTEFGVKDGGRICPKGNAGIMALYDPDRVRTPLKRTNPDKSPGADPRWQVISWDQALDEIAGKMRTLREANDAHKLLWISEDHSFADIQGDFMKLYGSPNHALHSNLCDVARKASFKTVMGDDRPLADFVNSRYIMLFGWNPISAIKWVHLPRLITQAVERGARLVVVDPYLSDTAAKAQEWVRLRPSTDGALALAMAHVIIRDKLYDPDFVASWTSGFDEYATYVTDKTPTWAAGVTTVPAETIERLAHELATAKPALIDAWSGPGQHSNGVQGGRAIALLNALIGTLDNRGGMVIPDRKGSKHIDVAPEVQAKATLKQPRFDELTRYPLGHKSGVYTQMFANLAEGKGPYQPKILMCVFQNPVMSVPGRPTVEKAIAAVETVVVVDTMLSETAMLADYVLPGTVYLERYDLTTHWVTWTAVGLRQPVTKPLFGQPAEYELVTALGRRLNLKDADGRDFFRVGPHSGAQIENLTAWYEDYLSHQLLKGGPGITLAQLKELPGATWVGAKGTHYRKYAAPVPADQLATAWFDGDPRTEGTQAYDKPAADGGRIIGTVIRGRVVRGFFTKSGKVEFVTPSLAEKPDANGKPVSTLPVYEPRDWQPSPDYPLYLINWKEASHTHTRTQNNPWLLEIKSENPLIIHPETAERFGVHDGETVRVESPHGSIHAKVKVSRRIHPEVVGLQHGFGHTALGRNAVKGQFDLPVGGQQTSPLVDSGVPQLVGGSARVVGSVQGDDTVSGGG
ncbi:MAG: molybdopterin-dependent oxidoreductase, partial [Actinobacteria bacterium]|nr:molybdopterin-dependent oxidoreductase [Actinomycetota bacterium]